MKNEKILIVDFGSPYTELIAQRIRENHVFSMIVKHNISAIDIKSLEPKGIIFSSGAVDSNTKKKELMPDKDIFKLNIPILGICYGANVILKFFGGHVKSSFKELDMQRRELFIDDFRSIFWQMPGNITSWMSCDDSIKNLPKNFKKIAHTQDNPIMAFKSLNKKLFGIYFHPEIIAAQRGNQVLGNFVYKICGCIGTWIMSSFIKETLADIKKTVGKGKVIVNLDGHLNSSVAALLINKVIGNRLKCVFLDNGLLRQNEGKNVKKLFSQNFHLNLINVDKSQKFLLNLKGVKETEEKEKIINQLSRKIFEEEIRRPKGIEFLTQGTNYSDLLRSDTNTDELLKDKQFKLKTLHPLKDLFKDEIKVLAKELGLSDTIIFRQQFPSTGLASRIIGEVSAFRLKVLREADAIINEEIKNAGIYEEVWQSFAVLISPKNIIAIRCVASTNGVTADWFRLPYDVMDKISMRILTKVKGVSRVVYDVSSKPPVSIEWK